MVSASVVSLKSVVKIIIVRIIITVRENRSTRVLVGAKEKNNGITCRENGTCIY